MNNYYFTCYYRFVAVVQLINIILQIKKKTRPKATTFAKNIPDIFIQFTFFCHETHFACWNSKIGFLLLHTQIKHCKLYRTLTQKMHTAKKAPTCDRTALPLRTNTVNSSTESTDTN